MFPDLIKTIKERADQGDGIACVQLAHHIYSLGITSEPLETNLEAVFEEVIRYAKLSLVNGYAQSVPVLEFLAQSYFTGNKNVPKNDLKGLDLCSFVIEKAPGIFNSARFGTDYSATAQRMIKRSFGHVLNLLGDTCTAGPHDSLEQSINEIDRGIEYYRQSVESGWGLSLSYLMFWAQSYLSGTKDVPKNQLKAFHLCSFVIDKAAGIFNSAHFGTDYPAAEQRNIKKCYGKALGFLGDLYISGFHDSSGQLITDRNRGVEYYRQSLKSGNASIIVNLGSRIRLETLLHMQVINTEELQRVSIIVEYGTPLIMDLKQIESNYGEDDKNSILKTFKSANEIMHRYFLPLLPARNLYLGTGEALESSWNRTYTLVNLVHEDLHKLY